MAAPKSRPRGSRTRRKGLLTALATRDPRTHSKVSRGKCTASTPTDWPRFSRRTALDKGAHIGNPRREVISWRFAAAVLLITSSILGPFTPAGAETLGSVFKRVNRSVVVVRTKETDVVGPGPGTLTR